MFSLSQHKIKCPKYNENNRMGSILTGSLQKNCQITDSITTGLTGARAIDSNSSNYLKLIIVVKCLESLICHVIDQVCFCPISRAKKIRQLNWLVHGLSVDSFVLNYDIVIVIIVRSTGKFIHTRVDADSYFIVCVIVFCSIK